MIPTPNSAGQWAVVPLAGVHMDFEAWMASFKFDKVRRSHGAGLDNGAQFMQNAYRGIQGAAKRPAQPRPSRRSYQRQLMLTPPVSPNLAPLRRRNTTTQSPPPTLTPSSSSSSSSLSASSSFSPSTISCEGPPLFTTDYFEVRKSPKGGYGAFAIKDIEKGTVIMAEEPLFQAIYGEVFYKYESLPARKREEYRSLVGWKGTSDFEVLAIFKTNRFEICGSLGGIFLKSSRFNHACHPYSTCTYKYDSIQGRLIVTSLFLIAKGEEITISYSPVASSLYDNYGFYCDCKACLPPAKAKAQADYLRGPVERVYE